MNINGLGIYATLKLSGGRIEITREYGNLTVQHFPTDSKDRDVLLVADTECTMIYASTHNMN